MPEETRRKLSEAGRGKRHSEETKRKMAEAARGHIVSVETRRRISDGKRNPSAETRRKLSEARRGRPLSTETKQKISLANRGRRLTEETKQRMSESKRGPLCYLWKGGPIDCVCEECGKTFKAQQWRITAGTVRFCCRKCVGAWHSRERSGPSSPVWRGGLFPYGLGWHIQKRRARNRDNSTCQRCGVTEEELGRRASVHHIIPFRESHDHNLENLICLCDNNNGQSCHKYIEHHPDDCPTPRKHWLLTA